MSDLSPPGTVHPMRALAAAIERASSMPVPIASIADPDTCPVELLPWLAWAESVDEWRADWSEARKRAAIKASRAIHEHKGTAAALKLAVATLGFDVEIIEWWQETPSADPYTFRALVVVDQEPIGSAAAFDQVVAAAESAKNLRSHMSGVDIKAITRADEYIGFAYWIGETITIAAEPA